jgi:hypothetical protein
VTKPLHLIVQDEITRDTDVTSAASSLGVRLTRIDKLNWQDQVAELEAEASIKDQRPVIFCSLPIAGRISRAFPRLASGIVLPKDFLQHAHYSALLPEDIQLNTGGIYLPWGILLERKEQLERLYPDGVFIRPNSSLKPFTGFAVTHNEFPAEHHMMTQAAGISATELCFVAPKADIPNVEYRVWIVDSQPVTAASYGWEDTSENQEVPLEVMTAARKVAGLLEMSEQIFTADFVMTQEGVKLVELNAVSTSGWYQGMDPKALIEAMDIMFI